MKSVISWLSREGSDARALRQRGASPCLAIFWRITKGVAKKKGQP